MNPSYLLPSVYGVDVAKNELVVAYHGSTAVVSLANHPKAIRAWLATVPKGALVGMESTGGYHEALARAAQTHGLTVYVLNPKAVRDYARGVCHRAKTDRVDAG